MAKATKSSVLKAWSERVGREDQYDLREVEAADGTLQTQLVDKDTGSISVAVDGQGQEALDRLAEEVGTTFLDAGVSPKESTGSDSAVQRTSRGVLATPTQPDATDDGSETVVVDSDETKGENPNDVPTHVNSVTGGSALGESSEKASK